MDGKSKQLVYLGSVTLLWLAVACGNVGQQPLTPTNSEPTSDGKVPQLGAQVPSAEPNANRASSPVPRPTTEPVCRDFAETTYRVCDYFLTWWEQGGGLQRFGLPISEAIYEAPEEGGDMLLVQYFERHIIQLRPPQPNQSPATGYYPVDLDLGTQVYKRKYPTGAPGQVPNKTQPSILFGPQNKGPWLGGPFHNFWANPPDQKFMDGGEWFGSPISDEFLERNEIDGKSYIVQYFERAALEYHPENIPPDDVQFAPLGLLQFRYRYPNGTPNQATPTPRPYVTPAPGFGCWTRDQLPPSNPAPGISLQQAEDYARKHFATIGVSMGGGEALGPLIYSKHVSVDITGPDSDYQLFEDAWMMYFRLGPEPKDAMSPSYSYGIYVDSDTGELLPGCEWTVSAVS
ncbi:MAG: hypothetical protein M3437_09450 [Chloroflexota bacterium]|nr:hypothetical protein [Chloroflexota bacterium]MDQ5866555.1 hypothetical protein [Chloroflexota bacterium]